MSFTEKTDQRKATLKALLWLIIKLAAVILCLWLTLVFVFGMFRLNGNNMYPSLRDGDLCITYRLDTYLSDDVIVYRADGAVHFGRIVARTGDALEGDEGGLIINGTRLSDDGGYGTQVLDTELPLPYTLREGEYVILNDFRSDLSDSRTYGIITENMLEGKLILFFRRRGF